jgi:hypothetical protein
LLVTLLVILSASSALPVSAQVLSTPTVDLNDASDTGASSADNITKDNTPTFSGTADASNTVRIYDGNGATPVCTTRANLSGNYSCTVTNPLTDGNHSITAQATSTLGLISGTSTALTVTIDTQAPQTTIDSGPSGPTNSTTATFAFSSNESNATFECKLDSEPFGSCSTPKPYNSLSEASHTFEVRATDTAGNTGSAASQTFTVDTEEPTVSLTAPEDGAEVRGTVSLSADATDNEGVQRVEFLVDSDEVGEDTTSPYSVNFDTTTLSDGSYEVSARAFDVAGSTTLAANRSSFTVNNLAPEVTALSKRTERAAPS